MTCKNALLFLISHLIIDFLFQSEFCEIKKKYDAARERLENDVKDITELIQVRNLVKLLLTENLNQTYTLTPISFNQEREGAYTDYQDASALKYSHVQSATRFI